MGSKKLRSMEPLSGEPELDEKSPQALMRLLKEQDEQFLDAVLEGKCGFVLSCDGKSVRLEPTRIGQWQGDYDGYWDGEPVVDIWSCSECDEVFDEWDEKPTWKYCPECGARMEGTEERKYMGSWLSIIGRDLNEEAWNAVYFGDSILKFIYKMIYAFCKYEVVRIGKHGRRNR